MDKSWTRERDRCSEKYATGVKSFMLFSIQYEKTTDNMIPCPCGYCNNNFRKSFHDVWKDLYEHGFSFSYSFEQWLFHGEDKVGPNADDNSVGDDDDSNTMHDLNGGLNALMDDVDAMHGEDDET